jgi:hypothetical protein
VASTATAANDTIFFQKARCALAFLKSGFKVNDFPH